MRSTVRLQQIVSMENYREIIAEEEARLARILQDIQSTLTEEEEDKRRKNQELAELKQQKLEAVGWREKREIEERIRAFLNHWHMRRYNDPIALNQPYFGVLKLADDDLGSLSYCLGRRSFFGGNGKLLVLDWREAPVSRLYYEYEAGEFYDEKIQGRERSGTIAAKRQVEASGGELRSILENQVQLVRDSEGEWRTADEEGGAVSRKEEKADHRLPEISALISREQFQAITHPESSTVILQGGAGSGKTTVGLHRIAYLAYQDPERFRPNRILVVVFNRSLRHYISGVLPQLGMQSGVQVETYHSWAGKLLRSAGIQVSYSSRQPGARIAQFKKSPQMMTLVDAYLQMLLSRSRDWFLEELQRFRDPKVHEITTLSLVAYRPRVDGLRPG
ncbi:UvrD-helicase domain-containing protein [Desulfoferrobacter suflitae]|uniref:UvrD-helicase domain-containing protein n=1 Tax=Desulfoferrobacter suflitae TaxID=2865782 RepID=UPI002164788E|nr:UvrD-helicase domain-containing protein [Desulfoferrobacter suflitae]MCK8600130.1 UvrD-helicase domain-containing protein [Desulfoferrobacter suflitae]